MDSNPVLMGELARACGVSRATTYIWARCGEIPVEFHGGRYELARADLPKIVQERGRKNAAETP